MHYVVGDFNDQDAYQQLDTLLDELKADNRLFYMATPPWAFPIIIEAIGEAELANCPLGWTRAVIEKPFGRDLESAQELDEAAHKVFAED
jgi:glucose-6-phosphate 1-dehydrogenase